MFVCSARLTHSRSIVSEVAGLVTFEETRRPLLGSFATGKAGVEVDYALHTSSILCGTNGLSGCQQHDSKRNTFLSQPARSWQLKDGSN